MDEIQLVREGDGQVIATITNTEQVDAAFVQVLRNTTPKTWVKVISTNFGAR